jgi:hypothetical protein
LKIETFKGEKTLFMDEEEIEKEPGLFTLKLATLLSLDIILKLKDV